MNRLKSEEQRMNKRTQSDVVENALLSKGKKIKKEKKFQKKPNEEKFRKQGNQRNYQNNQQAVTKSCFKCGKSGHFKNECNDKPCQAYLDYCKKKFPCNICNELGHFAKECTKGNNQKALYSVSLSASEMNEMSHHRTVQYQDSGATHHMTGNLRWLTNIQMLKTPVKIKLGDSSVMGSKCIGEVPLKAYDGKSWNSVILKQVLYVPDLTFNLFSLTTFLDKGFEEHSNAKQSVITENGKVILISERIGGLFKLKVTEESEYNLSAVSIKIWHERLAHQNVQYVRDILKKNNISYIDDWNEYVCVGYDNSPQGQLTLYRCKFNIKV